MLTCDPKTIEAMKDMLALMDEILRLMAERDAYRMVAQQAIHHCHEKHLDSVRLRASHERLLDEYRALREQVLARAKEAV